MKKIVIDARIIATPTGRYVVKLLDYLQELDKTNEYVVLVKPKDINFYKPTTTNFTIMECPYKEFTFGEQVGYLFFLRKLKADLVHFTQFHQPILYLKPKVTTMHDLTILDHLNKRGGNPLKVFYKYTIKPLIFKLAIKPMLNWSDAILTVSEYSKQDVLKRLKIKTPITVTLLSADIEPGPAEVYKPIGSQRFVFFVGNTAPYKNLQGLMAAMPKVYKETGAKLLIVGSANDFTPWLKEVASNIQLENDMDENQLIEWTGFVSDAELKWLYQNTAAYVVPSFAEGFGLPGLEAIAYGAPLASSNATCLPEVYGDAAHYFDPADNDDIADKIVELIKSEKIQKELAKARPVQIAKYDWARTARETHGVYEEVLARS